MLGGARRAAAARRVGGLRRGRPGAALSVRLFENLSAMERGVLGKKPAPSQRMGWIEEQLGAECYFHAGADATMNDPHADWKPKPGSTLGFEVKAGLRPESDLYATSGEDDPEEYLDWDPHEKEASYGLEPFAPNEWPDFLVEIARSQISSTDISGLRVRARVSGIENGQTVYDFGGDVTLVTPKPLHKNYSKSRSGVSADALRSAAAEADDEREEGARRRRFQSEVALPLARSTLMLYRGETLPDFDAVGAGADDPMGAAWAVIEDAARNKTSLEARVLNPINGGFAVAVGVMVGFLPNSHVSPFVRGPQHKQWEARTKDLCGERIWVSIITASEPERQLVVSHRMVARDLLHPKLGDTSGTRGAARSGRSGPSAASKFDPIYEAERAAQLERKFQPSDTVNLKPTIPLQPGSHMRESPAEAAGRASAEKKALGTTEDADPDPVKVV